ncbi:MAG TPA: LUD domain-containing protein [Pseudonocardiaceae bacterium]|nr:LUD domain-containing protein [Pseudonocardiaceae bacterium]
MKPVDQARNALAFLEEETHEHAFDKLIWGLRERRDAAAREIPEWEELRTLASQIKEHTLSNLAHYLELFEARATRNGAQVHWARDAHEHNQIVYDILSSRGARHLVKSMLTEECDTRPFLERRGIQVTETDLGERIQQLDDQPPSHIVGPAFQKTTQDVAARFHRERCGYCRTSRFYNRLNAWGRHRDIPSPVKETFHQWYARNRGGTHPAQRPIGEGPIGEGPIGAGAAGTEDADHGRA